MYLPALARDLYACQQEVESLERQLQGTKNLAQQEPLLELLRQARAELVQIRKIMEGRKEQSRASLNRPKYRF